MTIPTVSRLPLLLVGTLPLLVAAAAAGVGPNRAAAERGRLRHPRRLRTDPDGAMVSLQSMMSAPLIVSDGDDLLHLPSNDIGGGFDWAYGAPSRSPVVDIEPAASNSVEGEDDADANAWSFDWVTEADVSMPMRSDEEEAQLDMPTEAMSMHLEAVSTWTSATATPEEPRPAAASPSYGPTRGPADPTTTAPASSAPAQGAVTYETLKQGLTQSSFTIEPTVANSPAPTKGPVAPPTLAQNSFTIETQDHETLAPSTLAPTSSDLATSSFLTPTPTPRATKAAKRTHDPWLLLSNSPTAGPTAEPTSQPTTASPTVPEQEVEAIGSSVPFFTISTEPTSFPTEALIRVETNARLQLEVMSSIMDEEAATVFERACATFMNEMLSLAQPPVFGVECGVTNQELEEVRRRAIEQGKIGERRRRRRLGSSHRGLEGLTVLVDVNVKGAIEPSDTVMGASDIPFEELTQGTIGANSVLFVDQIKKDAELVEIDDFDGLVSIYIIQSPVDSTSVSIESPEGSGNSNSGSGDAKGDAAASSGILAAVVIGGMLALGLFASYFYHVGRRSDAAGLSIPEDESILSETDVYNDTLLGIESDKSHQYPTNMPPQLQIADTEETPFADITPLNGRSGDSRNDQLTYVYSLDDGLPSPSSLLSPPAGSPVYSTAGDSASNTSRESVKASWSLEDVAPLPSAGRMRVDIVAPAGKLGLIIDTCADGPVVHSVKSTSPLQGLVFKGDLVVAIDDEETVEWSAHYLTKLVAKKSKCERKITVLRNNEAERMEAK